MITVIFKRVTVFLMTFVLTVSCFISVIHSNGEEIPRYVDITEDKYFSEDVEVSVDLNSAVGEFVIQEIGSTGEQTLVFDKEITVPFSVEQSGYYNISLTYKILSNNAEQSEYGILINGIVPFNEAKSISLPTEYVRKNSDIITDSLGNELTPELVTSDSMVTNYLKDSSGYQTEPYAFYLESGENNITITVTDGKLALTECRFVAVTKALSYEEYLETFKNKGDSSKVKEVYQAENPKSRTSQAVIESSDTSTASVFPVSDRLTVLNNIGGESWSLPGQSATWEITVPQDGFYEIYFRYRQNFTNGLYTSRRIHIDGEVLFEELKAVKFPYAADWKNIALGEETPYKFYLTKGTHTLTAEATLGDMCEVVNSANNIILDLNKIYRNIISITSSSPDSYRDYQLDEKIPSTIEEIATVTESIKKLSKRLTQLVGKEVSENSLLERMVKQLEEFYEKPRVIPAKLSQFQSNISSLGTWVYERYKQPLAIDCITVASPDMNIKSGNAGFFIEFYHGFKQFIYSFVDDYDIADSKKNGNIVEVWTYAGRDQYQIINQLTEENYNSTHDSSAKVKLISESTLLPAVVAGKGPDVILQVPSGTPVNYAIRGAAYDLTTFNDFEKIKSAFSESAMVPFEFNGGTYALPVSMSFPVLFYRSDILNELGVDVPKTWNELKKTVVQLSQNQMEFGLAPSIHTYATFLYQMGGLFYNDKQYSALNEPKALSAFAEYTKLYREYGLTVSFDFANRFRSGEMPMAIVDYTMFNTLEVFSPEIKGLWNIAPVPGTENNGVIDNSVACEVQGTMMIADTDIPESAWEYMCWWTSSQVQTRYGRSIENKLGASARYPTANIEALAQMPWSSEFYKVLNSQLEVIKGVPEVAGGYFTSRHFSNAFRAVVYRSANPLETLREYTDVINVEIERKRTELGIE